MAWAGSTTAATSWSTTWRHSSGEDTTEPVRTRKPVGPRDDSGSRWNMKTRGRTEVLLAAALALVSVGAAVAGQEVGWLRAVLVLPLVLFLPGYVLVGALFPGRGASLKAEERALLSIGL